jgi:hypothetical protein
MSKTSIDREIFETIDLWISEQTVDLPPQVPARLNAEARVERWPLSGRPTRFPPPIEIWSEPSAHETEPSLSLLRRLMRSFSGAHRA